MSGDTGLRDIERMVAEEDLSPAGPPGSLRQHDVREDYRKHIQRFARPWSGRKAVIDTANGMGGLEVPLVLEGLGLDWEGLYLEVDGTFPNHEANPLKDENVEDLRRAVLERKADVGFAFGGDGDRCCVLDERGLRAPSDLVTTLLAREFLRQEPGASIVYDLRSSKVLAEKVKEWGGRPVRERVGHSFIKATMREDRSPFAGELSGHFYYRDHYYSDCATLAMIGVLNLMEEEGKPLSEIVAPLRTYHSSGEVNFEVKDPDGKIEALRAAYAEGTQDDLDGVTVVFPDYWFNVRKSNTEPLLRLRVEADGEALLAEKGEELSAFLRS